MIEFSSVTKRFADGTVAVDSLDLTAATGELTVLVGPSGCGKTTSLRMINRLDEATAGIIAVDGQDIRSRSLTELRRGIGYVMQHSGLFPHRTIGGNIATVPRLLGWDKKRIAARVDELIETVGLEAGMAARYPHQLSGGQQQRVGVARALAADPPIMLMDEPFAAVDPIVRKRLQDEFLALQGRLGKTIVFVTHDIDEAIRLGDRIAVFGDGGRLAQFATPDELLAAPKNDFVIDFLGAEPQLKRLSLISARMATPIDAPLIEVGASAEAAVAAADKAGTDWVLVLDDRRIVGWHRIEAYRADTARGAERFDAVMGAGATLRAALGALVISPLGVVARTDGEGRFDGLLDQSSLHRALS
ncbi:ABC transporter ATP-binding protein [Salinisphaera sp.]|uniref:ABC transporter ATP-binding protein n=1 Tax=Salinisphaera sp. TaxID=1914330 RepID=UPI002D779A89|nr:ATP-binding cassette domain-containing protein [Salinisphaera sp.]HET7313424.1 ATP-binding cassette domain-containing protein [Salinisphaera sp.]